MDVIFHGVTPRERQELIALSEFQNARTALEKKEKHLDNMLFPNGDSKPAPEPQKPFPTIIVKKGMQCGSKAWDKAVDDYGFPSPFIVDHYPVKFPSPFDIHSLFDPFPLFDPMELFFKQHLGSMGSTNATPPGFPTFEEFSKAMAEMERESNPQKRHEMADTLASRMANAIVDPKPPAVKVETGNLAKDTLIADLKEQVASLEKEVAGLVQLKEYRGNSISYIYDKAKNYGAQAAALAVELDNLVALLEKVKVSTFNTTPVVLAIQAGINKAKSVREHTKRTGERTYTVAISKNGSHASKVYIGDDYQTVHDRPQGQDLEALVKINYVPGDGLPNAKL